MNFPYQSPIKPSLKYLVFVSNFSERKRTPIREWVLENVVGNYERDYVRCQTYYRFAYRFELEDDAVRFKLWWG